MISFKKLSNFTILCIAVALIIPPVLGRISSTSSRSIDTSSGFAARS